MSVKNYMFSESCFHIFCLICVLKLQPAWTGSFRSSADATFHAIYHILHKLKYRKTEHKLKCHLIYNPNKI